MHCDCCGKKRRVHGGVQVRSGLNNFKLCASCANAVAQTKQLRTFNGQAVNWQDYLVFCQELSRKGLIR